VNTNKPDWKYAPEWANWLAQDSTGEWRWYQNAPSSGLWYWTCHTGSSCRSDYVSEGGPNPNWLETLERRPATTEGPYSKNIDSEYPPHIVVESFIDKNVEAVKAAFTERAIKGYEKYGTTTERTDIDLKGWLQHLQEELMDAVVYIERIKSGLND